jgi:hypothetical protein
VFYVDVNGDAGVVAIGGVTVGVGTIVLGGIALYIALDMAAQGLNDISNGSFGHSSSPSFTTRMTTTTTAVAAVAMTDGFSGVVEMGRGVVDTQHGLRNQRRNESLAQAGGASDVSGHNQMNERGNGTGSGEPKRSLYEKWGKGGAAAGIVLLGARGVMELTNPDPSKDPHDAHLERAQQQNQQQGNQQTPQQNQSQSPLRQQLNTPLLQQQDKPAWQLW